MHKSFLNDACFFHFGVSDVGEEPTLAEIEKILAENHDKAVEGFYITGRRLDEKISQSCACLEYALDVLDFFKASKQTKDIQTSYVATKENEGFHHKISMKAIGVGGHVAHDITINYFVMDEEKDKAEKKELEELIEKKDPFVFPNKEAKHGILDARIVNKYEVASNLGAMFGYAVSLGNKDYAQIMGVRFALMAEKIFGKKE